MTLLERLVIVIASVVLAVGIIVLLSGGLLAGRDAPGIVGHRARIGIVHPRSGRGQR